MRSSPVRFAQLRRIGMHGVLHHLERRSSLVLGLHTVLFCPLQNRAVRFSNRRVLLAEDASVRHAYVTGFGAFKN
jgi:hypothetical protein